MKQKFELTATWTGISVNGKVQIISLQILILLGKNADSGLKNCLFHMTNWLHLIHTTVLQGVRFIQLKSCFLFYFLFPFKNSNIAKLLALLSRTLRTGGLESEKNTIFTFPHLEILIQLAEALIRWVNRSSREDRARSLAISHTEQKKKHNKHALLQWKNTQHPI